jgi:putative chitinase
VASWNNPGGIGHIAVVRPGEVTDRGPAIAQAGASNFNNGHVRDSFGNAPVKYFVNDRGTAGQQQPAPAPSAPAPSAPTAPSEQAPRGGSYTVQPGDTLSGIAARHGSTVDAIARANGISNPNFIQVGQQLSIPGAGGGAPAPSTPSQPGPVSGPGPVTGPSEPGTAGGVSVQQLRAIMPNLSEARANELMPHLNRAMQEAGINTPRRQAAFLAQLAHESGEFRWMEEIASGAAYEGRGDLGNTQPGDGMRFKGRGPIQLTGRANYAAASQALGIDLVNNPTRAADPDVGFRTAAWYWNNRNLNSYADAGNFDAITYRVNGGYNGKAERDAYYNRALQVLGG